MGAVVLCAALLGARPLDAADEPQIITPAPSAYDAVARLTRFLATLQDHYVDPAIIHSNQHVTAALRAYLRSVDPTADYLPPDETSAVSTNDLGDIGLRFTIRNGNPTVIAPLDGSPAQNAGLLAGDVLRAVDGLPITDTGYFAFAARLRGAVGSQVALTVLEPTGGQRRDVTVIRTTNTVPATADFKFLGGGIAYARLAEFTEAAADKLRTELQRIHQQRARGLILDLRNNPGGDPRHMQTAAELFVPINTEIVTLAYARATQRATVDTDKKQQFAAPLILLVNAGTAAEAEIFAATLRDHKRARLVGSRTFGCGRHHEQVRLADGAVLYLPVATFLPPSRKPFHDVGLAPDVVVELPRSTERSLATAGFGTFNWTDDRLAVLATDRPLAKALELLAP